MPYEFEALHLMKSIVMAMVDPECVKIFGIMRTCVIGMRNRYIRVFLVCNVDNVTLKK